MVDKNIQQDLQKMVRDGLMNLDKNGEMELTEGGRNQAENLQKEDGAEEYMKQVAKYFKTNTPNKGSTNIKDIANEIDLINQTKLSIYERFDISENDDLKNYQLFCRLNDKLQKSKDGELGKITSKILSLAKYFEVPDNVNLLLNNTSNKVRKVRFPFQFNFLDVKVTIYDRIYYCFLIVDMDVFKKTNKKLATEQGIKINEMPDTIKIFTFYEKSNGDIGWGSINLYDKYRDKYVNKLKEYVMNFVDFVNSEDVKLMFREKTEKNAQRRIQRGKLPLPSYNSIYVVGYLAKHLKQLESQELNTRFSHRFWVKGHFRRFWDKKKYKKLYEQYKKGELKNFEGKKYNLNEGFLRIWVYPYIKGEGMLIEKEYKLK